MNPQDYIPKPCHENWETMTGNEQQRFCDKCSCSVHNLTGKNHEQIMNLRDKLGGKLCGAFHTSSKKKVRRVHLKRPLLIGASISTLALAACQSEEERMVLGGVEAVQPVRTVGEICPPETPDSTKKEPVKEPIKMGKIRLPE